MAAPFSKPSMKKPTVALPPRRGRVKAQIFEGIAEIVVSAVSRAGNLLGLVKKDDESAAATTAETAFTSGDSWRRCSEEDEIDITQQNFQFLSITLSTTLADFGSTASSSRRLTAPWEPCPPLPAVGIRITTISCNRPPVSSKHQAQLNREVLLEKPLTGHRVDRSICAWFWEQSLSQPDSFKPADLEKDPEPCVHFNSFELNTRSSSLDLLGFFEKEVMWYTRMSVSSVSEKAL
ncbi:hypothetical protein R6Q57_002798 [Mikania cordata]